MGEKLESEALEELTGVARTLANAAVRDWKAHGGRIVGTFCSYAPPEIVTAAGFLPFRMRGTGSTGTELADAYLTSVNCSFVRHCLNLGLEGEYGFLDGLVVPSTCDNIRRIYDNWKRKVSTPFIHMASLPKTTGDAQVEWYREELERLAEGLEKHFGVVIGDEELRGAIRLHNRARRLQRSLYDLRKSPRPPLTGAQMLAVTVAGTAMPVQQYVQRLEELLDQARGFSGGRSYRARLMLVGSLLDDPAYIDVIEEQGGLVVTDSLCLGSRLAWGEVDEEANDPLAALARYTIVDRPHCPRMSGTQQQRADFVMDMIREFSVDGVLCERLMFCDYWTTENYLLGKDFKEAEIPFLRINREYLLGGVGQLRTRVQAFLETIER